MKRAAETLILFLPCRSDGGREERGDPYGLIPVVLVLPARDHRARYRFATAVADLIR